MDSDKDISDSEENNKKKEEEDVYIEYDWTENDNSFSAHV